MTFVSRRTRITVSRCPDESDAEYKLRVCRKRSDGRLKRYTSCDDLRAWVNDNCIKHEYLVDLMSDGECTRKNSLCMYGRYIPVPLLLKLFRNFKESKWNEIEGKSNFNETKEDDFRDEKRDNREKSRNEHGRDDLRVEKTKVKTEPDVLRMGKGETKNDADVGKRERDDFGTGKREIENGKSAEVDVKKNGIDESVKIQKIKKESRDVGTECECRNESNEGDNENLWIVQCEKYLLEKRFFECRSLLNKAVVKLERIDCIVCGEKDEIEIFRNCQMNATFPEAKSFCSCSTSNNTSFANLKREKEVARCREVLRKISRLRQRLKTNRDRQREVSEQIRQGACPKPSSRVQVTELFSQRNEAKLRSLQKKLEKLIAVKGKLLSELIEAVSHLNKLKKSVSTSRSRLSFGSKCSFRGNDDGFRCGLPVTCFCGCQCESSNSPASGELSQDDSVEPSTNAFCHCRSEIVGGTASKRCDECDASDLVTDENDDWKFWQTSPRKWENRSTTSDTSTWKSYRKQQTPANETTDVDWECSKRVKKSKLRFAIPGDASRGTEFSGNDDDRSNGQERAGSNGKVAGTRPNTADSPVEDESRTRMPERKVKSETAMEEIEKALRNYDKRLRNLDCIEYDVGEMKEKMAADEREMRELRRENEEGKEILAGEREKAAREMNQLFLENRSLKKQIQQLIANSDKQMKTIQNHQMFEKELECEANELNNRLTQCQDDCENQRKRIAMLEGYIVNQDQEIRKLTNMINNPKMRTTKGFQDSTVQRSRSYSPESKKNKRTIRRPMTQGCRCSTSSDEDIIWGCEEAYQQNARNQARISGKGCRTSQPVRRRA